MNCIAIVARAIVDADSRNDSEIACFVAWSADKVVKVVAAGADDAARRSQLLTDCAFLSNSVCHVYELVRLSVLLPDYQADAESRYDGEEDKNEDRT